MCAGCGRSFARKFSAQRHIIHLERGLATLVTKDQYELGIRAGAIIPRPYRPTYRKSNVRLVDLFKQKLKEKVAEMLAKNSLRDPESRKIVFALLLNESLRERADSGDNDEFSAALSGMMRDFRPP
jgi:hypothetical protein